MTGIPPHLALLFGLLIGMLGYGPVERWIVAVRRALVDQAERPDLQRKDSRKLLFIFATMHPAPWLFILGIPFAVYQVILGPLPRMWLWLIAGVGGGVALMLIYYNKFAGRARA